MIGEEFTEKWESLPPNIKVLLAGMSKEDFAKQPSSIKSFHVGSSNNTPKKQRNNTPQQQSQSYFKPDKESPAIKPPNMALQGTSKKHQHTNRKPKNPNVNQQKQFFCQTGPSNSKSLAAKSGVKLTHILLVLLR